MYVFIPANFKQCIVYLKHVIMVLLQRSLGIFDANSDLTYQNNADLDPTFQNNVDLDPMMTLINKPIISTVNQPNFSNYIIVK